MSYALIAYLSQAKGIKGEVVANPTDAHSFALREGLKVWVVPPLLRGVRETRLLTVKTQGENALITLSGIKDRNDALALLGRYLLVDIDDIGGGEARPLAADEDGSGYVSGDSDEEEPSAVGLEVEDVVEGYLGVIVEERRGVAQTLWVVDGPFGELLIPAVEPFIVSRDGAGVKMVLPKGLLELNA